MIEINLIPDQLRSKVGKPGKAIDFTGFLWLIPLLFLVLIAVHILLIIIGIANGQQLRILNNKWKALEPQRKVAEEFNKEFQASSADIKLIQQLTSQRINWSEKLNNLSLALPSGIWFNEISFLSNREFVLSASIISLQKQEMRLINKFVGNLKKSPGFFKGFNNLELSSIKRRIIGGYDIVDFIIAGRIE
jgi:Tfp pilus assembly protein PilN